VERGGEEARARRWAAGTPAAAIKAGGLGGRPFQGEEGVGMAWGGDDWVLRALEGRGGGAGRRIDAGHRAAGPAREVERASGGWRRP
jgi:hypothetical protein